MKLPFQKSIVLTLGLITFALIVVGFIFYLTTTNFISDSDWVTHTHKVVEQIEATYGGIKDAESAERSYLLTGDKDYLVSFTTAVNSINSSEQELRALTLDNSLQQQRVDSLGHLLDARIKLLTASIDLYNTQGLSAVQENIKSGQGKQIVAQINTVIAQLNTEERRLLDERTTNVHNSAQTFTFVFLILIAVVFSLLSFVFVLLRRDARERRQSEKLLRTQRELTANLIQNSAVATVGLDTDHKVIVWNKAAEELTGLKAEEVIGTGNHWKGFYNQQRPTLNDILIDGSFELLPEYYDTYAEQSILSTEALHAEAWFNNLGGKRRFVVFDAAPVFDSEGKMLAAITTLQDFTEHKKVEEAMREGEKRFRTLVQNMQVGVLVQGPKAEILINNQAALDLLEVTQDQLLGRSSFDPDWRTIAEDGSDLPGDKHPVPVAIATKQPVKNAVMGVWRPHTFTWGWLLVNAVPQLDAEGEVTQVICTFTDITDRKNVERMKNEFISTVSHELRTPLTSIRGSLGLLIGGIAGDLPSQARSMIEIAHKNSERLVRLINDILDIEKIESGKMVLQRKPYELNSLVQQAIENNQGLEVQYGIQFELVETLSGPKVNVDHDRMMQVLANLLSNAAKFSPNGEKVEVRIARQRDRKLRVSIKDHGPGIPPEFQPRIFQKFAQADSSDSRQKGGTGLGLNITKALIERFGGQIGFETEFNRGSVFYFDLPEYKETEEATVNSLQPVYEPGILICEDDHDVAALLSLVLSQHHFKTDIAYTVTQARKLLKENKYDAMTLDIMLPDQDGISFLRELRSQQETLYLPIIVVSVKAETSRQELNGNALAVIDWIEKPLNQERLVSAVTQATRQLKSKTSFPRILHIEDDPDIIEIVKIMLNGIAEVISVTTGEEARKTLELNNFDLVLLDLELPDCSGLELLPLIQSHSNLPVVVFSAQEMSQDLAREVAAALVKSKTSNIELLNVIKSLVTSEKGDLLQTQAPQK